MPLNRSTQCCLARPCAPARPWDLSSADKADGKQGDPSQRGTAAWSAAGGCTGRHRSPRVTGRRGAAGSPIIPRTVGKLGFVAGEVLASMLLRPEAIQALENLGLWTFDRLRLSDWVHLHSGALLGFYNDPSFVGGPFSETRVLVGVEDCSSSMPSRTPTPAFCMRTRSETVVGDGILGITRLSKLRLEASFELLDEFLQGMPLHRQGLPVHLQQKSHGLSGFSCHPPY